jgi:hypothetical protein
MAELIGDLLHLVQQRLLAAPERLGDLIVRRGRLRGGREGGDLSVLLGLELLARPLAALVVGSGRRRQQLRLAFDVGFVRGGCSACTLPLAFHGPAMN